MTLLFQKRWRGGGGENGPTRPPRWPQPRHRGGSRPQWRRWWRTPEGGKEGGGVSLAMEKEGGCDGHEQRAGREGRGRKKQTSLRSFGERERTRSAKEEAREDGERTTRPPKKEERDAFEKSRRAEKSAGKKCGLKRESRAKLARRTEGRSGCNLNGASPRSLARSLAHSKHLCNNVHARCNASDRQADTHTRRHLVRSPARSFPRNPWQKHAMQMRDLLPRRFSKACGPCPSRHL